MKRIVVKVGTNVITKTNGLLNMAVLRQLVEQIVKLNKKGTEVILVSSGAMGAGRSLIKLDESKSNVVRRQVLAAVGQIELLKTYQHLFKENNGMCAQVLATKEDFRDREHYLNMKNCFDALLENKIVPIVNENDVISVTELMFTDNDELAGLIASMEDADGLMLLSSVDGVLDESCKKIIQTVDSKSSRKRIEQCIRPDKSSFGRGGMLTKVKMAKHLAEMGITTFIANGQRENVILDLANNKKIGTCFVAKKHKTSSVKRWIAQSRGYEKGTITIDKGAEKALTEKISSLLPVGVKKIEGEFKKGDIVKIKNEFGKDVGFGTAAYGSKTARSYKGEKGKKALIHYDYLVLKP